MSKIINDIVDDLMDDIDIKPKRSKLIVKWTIRISVLAIVCAFLIGQRGVRFFNSISIIKSDIVVIKEDISDLKKTDEKLESSIKENENDIDENHDDFINYKLKKQ